MSNAVKVVTLVASLVAANIVGARLLNGVSAAALERKAAKDLAKHTGRDDLVVTIKPAWLGNRWSVVVTDKTGNVVHKDTFVMKTVGFFYQWTTYGAWVILVRDSLKEGEQV